MAAARALFLTIAVVVGTCHVARVSAATSDPTLTGFEVRLETDAPGRYYSAAYGSVATCAVACWADDLCLLFTRNAKGKCYFKATFGGVTVAKIGTTSYFKPAAFPSPPPSPPPPPALKVKAVAVLKGTAGAEGNVTLEQTGDGPTTLTIWIGGLSAGKHGFHVHTYGDVYSNGCISAGPHYNPFGLTHGGPMDTVRHAGDLGNVEADSNGVVSAVIMDSQVSLTGAYSILGRGIVVHSMEDDLGKGGVPLSLTTGNSGTRIACGPVVLAAA